MIGGRAAVSVGIRDTAGIITGAALIMLAEFAAFSISPLANMREIGVGLAVAVMLDATVIRLVLLPIAMDRLGEAAWWRPGRQGRTAAATAGDVRAGALDAVPAVSGSL